MSTVTKMQATGEIVVGLDKSAAGWRAAASAPSTGQPLRAVHVLSCSREGVIAVTPAAEDGPAEVRESAEACVDQLERRPRSFRVMDGIAGPRPCEPRPASCGPPADQVLEDRFALDMDSRRPEVM